MPANLSDLEQQNPNIRSLIQEWQTQRASNGENPTDWEAFRQHAQAVGAPDPGQEAPGEFLQSAAGSAASGIMGRLTGQQPQQQTQQPQQQTQQPEGQQQEGQQEQGGERGGGILGRILGGR